MASVVGSSYVSQELKSHIGIFLRILQNEPAPDKSRFFNL